MDIDEKDDLMSRIRSIENISTCVNESIESLRNVLKTYTKEKEELMNILKKVKGIEPKVRNKSKKEYVCPKCSKQLCSKNSLSRHLKNRSCEHTTCFWITPDNIRCSNKGLDHFCHLHKRGRDFIKADECVKCDNKIGFMLKIKNFIELQNYANNPYKYEILYNNSICTLKNVFVNYTTITLDTNDKDVIVWINAKKKRDKDGITLSKLKVFSYTECKKVSVLHDKLENHDYCVQCFEKKFNTSVKSILKGQTD